MPECTRRQAVVGLVLLGLMLALVGWWRGEFATVVRGMTYGNFDVPNRASFVHQRMVPGTDVDYAQRQVYRFDAGTSLHRHDVVAMAVLFVVFAALLFGGAERRQEWKRRLSQWLGFVGLRLGVLRVADVCPLRRTTLGVVPVLNCQGCEMATGACPIGTLQVFLLRLNLPLFLVGSMTVFGALLGRFACGWLCPFGMLSDLMDRVSKHRWRPPHAWRAGKFVMLGLVVVAGLVFGLAGATTAPFCFTFCPSGKVLGLLPYYFTHDVAEAGAVFTSPLTRTVGFLCMWWHLLVALAFVAAMLWVSGRVFCSYLCPLGGFLGLFHRVAAVRVVHDPSVCSHCDRCLAVCPMHVDLASPDFLTQSDCVACGRCTRVCNGARRFSCFTDDAPGAASAAPAPSVPPPPRSAKVEGCYVPLAGRITEFLLPMLTMTPQAMARYAKATTAFYARFYEGRDPDDFDALPVLHKREVRACSPYDLLARPFRDRVSLYGETTGSTGSPTPSFLTGREFAGAALLSKVTPYAGKMAALFRRNRTCVNGLAFGFTIAGQSFGDMLTRNGGLVANVGSRSTLATPPRTADAIARLRPGILTGTPIDVLCWLRIVKEDHPADYERVLAELEVVLTSAELCAASRSRAMEEHFGVNHVDNYATVEGFFTMACPCGSKHVLPIYLTELFDGDLRKLGRWGRGRLAFTNLIKRSSPLIRYLLDDLVTISPSHCPWGFAVDIVPHGRYELSVRVGDELLNVEDFEEQIFREGLFGDYRMVLHEGGRAEVVLEDYAAPAGAADRVAERLRERFELEPTVTLQPFGTLTPYRDVRVVKPILKIDDRRSTSQQDVPEVI